MSMTDRMKREKEREREARAQQRVEEDAQPTGYEQEKEETQEKKEAPFDDAKFGALLEQETLEVGADGRLLYRPDYDFNSHPYGRDAMQVHEVSLPSYFIGIGTMEPH